MISNEKNDNANFEKILPFLMETIDDLIIIASSNNSFEIEQIFECKFLEQLGYSNNKLIGKSMLSIFHFGDGITRKDFIRLIEQEKSKIKIQIIKKNGNLIWAELTMKKFNDEKSQEKYILKLRNISDLKELELKLGESEKNFKKIAKKVPEVRFWDLFTPKEYDKALHSSSEKLRQNEAKFHTAIESLPFDFFMINKDGYYVMQNTACKENWGNIIGKRPEDIANSKDTLAIWKENNSRAFSGEIVKTEIELKIDERIHYFYNIITPVYIDDKIEYIQGVNIDTTDRKIAEQKLKESEEKYRLIYENANDLIRVFNNNFEFEYLNEKVHKRVLEYSIEELTNIDPILLFHPEDRKQAIIRLSKILRKGEGSYEARFKHKDGHYKWLELSAKNFVDSKGNKKILSIGRDITDRKIIEQRIKESEEKYRDIAELLPDIIYEGDLNLNLTYVNSVAFKKFGYTPEDLESGLKMTDFLDSQYREKAMIQIKSSLEGNPTKPEQYLMRKKDGSTFYARIHSRPILKDNKVVGIRGTITDISDIILAKQELKESEQKFRNIFESIPDMFFLLSEDTTILDYHGKKEELYIPPDEFMGKKMKDILPSEIGYLVKEYVEKTLITNKPQVLEYELPIRDEIHYFEARFLYFSEKTIAIFIRDITKRKIIEEKLKESEAKYHKLFETSPDGVVLTDLNGTILETNSALESISGYSSKEFLGKNFMDLEIYHENALDVLLKGYEDLLNENRLEAVEFPIKTKKNTINWVQVRSTLINMKGKTCILTVIHDITTLKEAEEALRKNEEKFRDILETSSVGIMELDVIKKKLLYINPKLLNMIGFNKEELTEEVFRHDIIHPKDLTKLLKTNEEGELEFRIKDKQGKLKWLAGKRIPHFNETGEITRIRVWLDDITEKKMYENLIYELNINFLNFTTDIRNNIDLLLNTCLNLLDGDLILYIHKIISDDQENYQIISSDETYIHNSEDINQLFLSALFHEEHDFPQTFFDIDRMKYAKTDPFIIEHKFKGSFGKVIKSNEGFNSAVCIFYKNNPIISGEDKLVLFLICDALEIEQRRWQVQEDLEKQNITLNKINKLKSELFSRTSHELKTPLISVKGFTELLLTLYKSKLDPEIISILEEISDGSKRLEKIINLLLESTKLEAGQLFLNLQDENLTFLIKFCVKELQGLAKLRDQTISLNLQDMLETKFDKERIYEVISNLLVNAIKYTPPGGNITIESKINEESYEISIKDNGIGFTEEEKNQVFRQFGKIERYGQGWDIAADGTGLGLYITKKLVELHGGKIWLESEGRNKGTIFHFSIPILK